MLTEMLTEKTGQAFRPGLFFVRFWIPIQTAIARVYAYRPSLKDEHSVMAVSATAIKPGSVSAPAPLIRRHAD